MARYALAVIAALAILLVAIVAAATLRRASGSGAPGGGSPGGGSPGGGSPGGGCAAPCPAGWACGPGVACAPRPVPPQVAIEIAEMQTQQTYLAAQLQALAHEMANPYPPFVDPDPVHGCERQWPPESVKVASILTMAAALQATAQAPPARTWADGGRSLADWAHAVHAALGELTTSWSQNGPLLKPTKYSHEDCSAAGANLLASMEAATASAADFAATADLLVTEIGRSPA